MYGHLELLKFLLEKNPQVDNKNIFGKTPLDLAINSKIKDFLTEYINQGLVKFTKVTIHKTNMKSANNLILNFKQQSNKEKSPQDSLHITSNDKNSSTKEIQSHFFLI